jgi:hypothetical protein
MLTPMIAMMGAEADCFGVGFNFGLEVTVGILVAFFTSHSA